MIRRTLILACMVLSVGRSAGWADELGPEDPIAAVDGKPIYLGELNLLVTEKLRSDLPSVPETVRRASAQVLVKRHMAMQTLLKQGGEKLQRALDREWSAFETELRSQESSAAQFAEKASSTVASLRASRDWDVAWNLYLKKHMTESNVRRFFASHQERYSGSRWKLSHLFLEGDAGDLNGITRQRIEEIHSSLLRDVDSFERLAESFARYAREESDGATSAEGGALGWVSAGGELPRSLMRAIIDTDEQCITPPLMTHRGAHLFLVHAKETRPTQFEELDDTNAIRRDVADFLFDELVSRNGGEVRWFVRPLMHVE